MSELAERFTPFVRIVAIILLQSPNINQSDNWSAFAVLFVEDILHKDTRAHEMKSEGESFGVAIEECPPREMNWSMRAMAPNEIELRDKINSNLARKGFHLRIRNLVLRGDAMYVWDFVPPIGNYIDEDQRVVLIVNEDIENWLKDRRHSLRQRV